MTPNLARRRVHGRCEQEHCPPRVSWMPFSPAARSPQGQPQLTYCASNLSAEITNRRNSVSGTLGVSYEAHPAAGAPPACFSVEIARTHRAQEPVLDASAPAAYSCDPKTSIQERREAICRRLEVPRPRERQPREHRQPNLY